MKGWSFPLVVCQDQGQWEHSEEMLSTSQSQLVMADNSSRDQVIPDCVLNQLGAALGV
jgi:hypothetical protein